MARMSERERRRQGPAPATAQRDGAPLPPSPAAGALFNRHTAKFSMAAKLTQHR
jgi:hypothetical protein